MEKDFNAEQAKIDGLKAAMNNFSKFHPAEMSEVDCTIALFQKYGEYLLTLNFACGTMTQYLSGVFNSLKTMFPNLSIWNVEANNAYGNGAPKWYLSIRNIMVRTMVNRVIQEGKKLQEKSEPIGRNLLCKIAYALLKTGDIHSVEMRAAFNTDFHCCGRTGELATASYGTAFWDDVEQTLKTDWSMEKTSGQKLLFLYPDYSSYLPCVFHSIACLMICGNGRRFYKGGEGEETHWMFANLAMNSFPVRLMN